eukprot:3199295-Lingulodinium_polyedra.AAC.1
MVIVRVPLLMAIKRDEVGSVWTIWENYHVDTAFLECKSSGTKQMLGELFTHCEDRWSLKAVLLM